MKLSNYFLPLLKETPSEAKIASHQLMLRTGMICQEVAGIYSWLPLGLRVLKKIEKIIREELTVANCAELLMPILQSADVWRESGRYESYGKEMLRIKDRHDRDLLYSPTNEDMMTALFRRFVKSYRQFPLRVFQIQWKFRDEVRPRFGVMRGREFLMQDAYSFDLSPDAARATYYDMMRAYLKIFKRLGVDAMPVQADTGPIGGELSHEFHIFSDTGENEIFYDIKFETLGANVAVEDILKLYAKSGELHDPEQCPVSDIDLTSRRGIEVGHIFNFGTKYTEAMNAPVAGPDGKPVYPEMSSFGIGVSRLVAGIIEVNHDDRGIKWPIAISPFHVGILNLKVGDAQSDHVSTTIYAMLTAIGFEVLLNDRNESSGSKFATMDLIGLPWQVIVSPRGLRQGTCEVKARASGSREELSLEGLRYFFETEWARIKDCTSHV